MSGRVEITLTVDDLDVGARVRDEGGAVLERISGAVLDRKAAANLLRSIADDLDPAPSAAQVADATLKAMRP